MNNWDRHFQMVIEKTTAMIRKKPVCGDSSSRNGATVQAEIRANSRKHGEQTTDRTNQSSLTSECSRRKGEGNGSCG